MLLDEVLDAGGQILAAALLEDLVRVGGQDFGHLKGTHIRVDELVVSKLNLPLEVAITVELVSDKILVK